MCTKRIMPTLVGSLFLFSCNLLAQSPGSITNQSFWLKGVYPNDATQGSQNFNPTLAMNTDKSRIDLSGNIASLQRTTIFTVYQNPNTEEERFIWELTGRFGDLSLSTRQVSSKSRKTNIVFSKNKATAHAQSQGAIIHTYLSYKGNRGLAEHNDNLEASIRFGSTPGTAQTAQPLISEFILYERILNEREIARVETYLALKYGVTLERNYLNSSGEIVWNQENEKKYSHNIAGIGRDDRSSLYQKQSTSCNNPGQLVIGANKIVESNNENSGQINDRDYLIWGDNGQGFTLEQVHRAEADDIRIFERHWLMRTSGRSASMISTELRIDTKTMLPAHFPKKLFCLVINRSAVGGFAPKNCIFIMPDSISSDGIASFSNVYWDADGSGKDAFTFGFKPGTSPANLVSFKLYPNPVTDGNYKMAINLDKPSDIQIQVYDPNNRLVDSQRGFGQASYLFSGQIKAAAGAYAVCLITPDSEFCRIIIIQ